MSWDGDGTALGRAMFDWEATRGEDVPHVNIRPRCGLASHPKIKRTRASPVGRVSRTHEKNGKEDERGLAKVEEQVGAHRSCWSCGRSGRAHGKSPIREEQDRE
jgi:hypothetical protein